MHSSLIDHIQKSVTLTESEIQLIEACFKHQAYKKKALLLHENELCRHYHFVVKGCLRLYIINKKGNEQTLQFALENWWLTDHAGFDNQKPSHFCIQAIEPSTVLSIDKKSFDELLITVPSLERYFRTILQRAFGATQMRINYLYTQTAEERYTHFNSLYPEFVQRVPQYMLATYLDFSPEFMSKIRAGKT
jgi:CRP-like cAMP-binding protein